MDLSTIGNFLSNNSTTIGSLAGTAAQAYGQQNAGEAITNSDIAGIGQANTTLGNINSLYQPQTTLGNSAMNAIGSAEGLNGAAPDYSGFENMPGYQFAVDQGTQAIQRQAASMGSAYTPNTAQAVGQYVTGTAMQDYNNYISQLQNSASLGAQANQTLSGANLQTAGNIEQMGQNSGLAQAGVYTGLGQTVGGALGSTNASGTSSGTSGTASGSTIGSGVTSLIGKGLNYLGQTLSGTTGGGLSALGSSAAASTAAELGSAAAPALAADTAAALAPSLAGIGTGATAAELGTTASALAPFTTAAAAPAAASAASGAGAAAGSALGAAGAAAIPLALIAAAAFVPSSEEFTPQTITSMEDSVKQNTTVPGQLNSAASYQTVNNLMSLEYENPEEFAQSGGTGPITTFLQSLGYSPVDWNSIGPRAGVGSGSGMGQGNTSGKQL